MTISIIMLASSALHFINPKISIVMAYYNRYSQLITTLDTILSSTHKNIEVIIVDDCSTDRAPIDNVPNMYSFPIRIIHMDPEKKTYTNSCVPYNEGLNHVTGDITIIQNPEVCHIGDVLRHIATKLGPNDYYSYACIALPHYYYNTYIKTMISVKRVKSNNANDYTLGLPINVMLRYIRAGSRFKKPFWLNNPSSPTYFHYCAATYTANIKKVRGFSLEYKDGRCFDDDDLVLKMQKYLGLNMVVPPLTECFVLHQYHPPSPAVNCLNFPVDNPVRIAFLKNQEIFTKKKQALETLPLRNSIPKIFHAYWDGSPMTLLNYLTIRTFRYYNPEYEMIIWTPTSRFEKLTWKEDAHRTPYTGVDYWPIVQAEPYIKIRKIDAEEIGFRNDVSEIFKSDYIRAHLLYIYGGLWSDLDIFYLKPMSSIEPVNGEDFDTLLIIAVHRYIVIPQDIDTETGIAKRYEIVHVQQDNKPDDYEYPVLVDCYFANSFIMSAAGNKLFSDIKADAIKYFDPDRYQSLGSELFDKKFDSTEAVRGTEEYCRAFTNNIKSSYPEFKINMHSDDLHLPIPWHRLDKLYCNCGTPIPKTSIGIHLFAGSATYKDYCNDPKNLQRESLISTLIRKFTFLEKNHDLTKGITNLNNYAEIAA